MTKCRQILLCLLLLSASICVAESEQSDDTQLSFEDKLNACAACHGERGDKPLAPDYPILAGQHADYLANSLHSYIAGRRENAIMSAQMQALNLTDEDIERLAAYFAAQSGLTTLKSD